MSIENFKSLPEVIDYGNSLSSNSALVAVTPQTIFTPAANTNGAIVWDAQIVVISVAGVLACLISKNAAPTNEVDGDIVLQTQGNNAYLSNIPATLNKPVKIPAGKGLYWIANATTTGGFRHVLYTLL